MKWRRRRIGKRRRALRKRALPEPSFVVGENASFDILAFLDVIRPIVMPAVEHATDAPYSKAGNNWNGYLDGFCPVQGYGLVDGLGWYFRSRWDAWTFEVFRTPIDPISGLPDEDPIWEMGADYGEEPDASWMPYSEAWIRIEQSIALFQGVQRAGRAAAKSEGEVFSPKSEAEVSSPALAEAGVESYVTGAAVEGGLRP